LFKIFEWEESDRVGILGIQKKILADGKRVIVGDKGAI